MFALFLNPTRRNLHGISGHSVLVTLILLGISVIPQTVLAQRSFNLNSLIDAGKSLAQSASVGSMSQEDEVAIGKEVAAVTMGTYPPVRDSSLQHKLNQIGYWIALQSTRPDLPWRFAAVKSDSINAFAAPGGTILVTQGMLEQVANEAELGCVLGHEIAHVTRRHHIAVLQKSLNLAAGASLVSTLASSSGKDVEIKQKIISESKEIFTRGLDRGSEREADEDGVLLAARAGYDPAACLNFMQRLATLKGDTNALASLYKTHPTAKDRAEDVDKALSKMKGASPGEGARPDLTLAAKKKSQ